MRKILGRICAVAATAALSSTAYAEAEIIEIVGLIPDVSSQSEVAAKLTKANYIEVGGLFFHCTPAYLKDRLAELDCTIAEKNYDGKGILQASKMVAVDKLVKGFSKKFNTQPAVDIQKLVNRLGIQIDQHTYIWKGKSGGMLWITDIKQDNIREGQFVVVSPKQSKIYEQMSIDREASEQF